MVKIETKSRNVTPYAGIFFVNEEFKSSGIQQMIDTELGVRSSTRGYSYGHLFKNRFNIFLCGGECAEDIHEHLRPTLEQIPGGRTASPDTLLRFLNELSTENTQIESSKGKRYEFNINTALNDLNIKLLIKTGQLNKGACYDFDYDNQIIEHEKWDAKATYKKNTGYFPGIATIGDKIVYIENRVGNANVKSPVGNAGKSIQCIAKSRDPY
jgi:hypothetical protein